MVAYNFVIKDFKIQVEHILFTHITAKRPDQAHNKRPTLGHTIQSKTSTRYRQGYHYQPIPSTSQQSPTFVLESREYPIQTNKQHHYDHGNISDGCVSGAVPVAGPSSRSDYTNHQTSSSPTHQCRNLPSSSSANEIASAVA